jgi:hypothetical protein
VNQKKILIDVYPDGTSKVDTQGFKGATCSLASKEIELVLSGGDMSNVKDDKKPDFFAQNVGTQSMRNG